METQSSSDLAVSLLSPVISLTLSLYELSHQVVNCLVKNQCGPLPLSYDSWQSRACAKWGETASQPSYYPVIHSFIHPFIYPLAHPVCFSILLCSCTALEMKQSTSRNMDPTARRGRRLMLDKWLETKWVPTWGSLWGFRNAYEPQDLRRDHYGLWKTSLTAFRSRLSL